MKRRWQQQRGSRTEARRLPPGAAAWAELPRSRLQLLVAGAQPPNHAHASSDDSGSALPPAVRAFLSAFNERSVAGMAACLAPQATYINLSHAQPYRGKQV